MLSHWFNVCLISCKWFFKISPINEEILCQDDGVRMDEAELTNAYMFSNVNVMSKSKISDEKVKDKKKLNVHAQL